MMSIPWLKVSCQKCQVFTAQAHTMDHVCMSDPLVDQHCYIHACWDTSYHSKLWQTWQSKLWQNFSGINWGVLDWWTDHVRDVIFFAKTSNPAFLPQSLSLCPSLALSLSIFTFICMTLHTFCWSECHKSTFIYSFIHSFIHSFILSRSLSVPVSMSLWLS